MPALSDGGTGVALDTGGVIGTAAAPVTDWGRRLVSSPEVIDTFSRSAGPVHLRPRGVLAPRSTAELASLVQWARAEGQPLVPRGAGTGMPGGNVGPGVALDLRTHFDWVDPPDPVRGTIRAGVGAIANAVDQGASSIGRFLPFLPSSRDRCAVGGMVANNAAGARSFRFGAVRPWIESLEIVLADGRICHLGGDNPGGEVPSPDSDAAHDPGDWPRVRKNSSGYHLPGLTDPLQLLPGSEGTLALVTAATFRTEPLPEALGVAVLGLEALDLLPEVALQAEELGFWACEFFHRSFLDIAGLDDHPEIGPLCAGVASVVLLEIGGSTTEVAAGLRALEAWSKANALPVVMATEPAGRRALWAVRHSASPIIAAQADRGLMSTQFIEDSVVPVKRLAEYLAGLQAILDRERMAAVLFGHAGDGNVHVNPLVDRTAPDWRDRVRRILEETADLVRSLGGTLAGEHGDGRIRAPLLGRIWGDANLSRFRAVKAAWDPTGIMNPGVVLPLPGQDPLEGMGAGWHTAHAGQGGSGS